MKDASELKALVEAGRKGASQPPAQPQTGDIKTHPDFLKLGHELGETRESLKKFEAERVKLSRMADEARRGKIRSLFLAAGSGPVQADDAGALFESRFSMGEDGSISTLGQLKDGTVAPLGQKPEDLAKELLKERPYLVAPAQAGGVGSRVSQKKPADTGDAKRSPWGGTGESRLEKSIKRRAGK